MKKKYFNLALIYAIFGMVAGVFYRDLQSGIILQT